ncbi:MAG: class II aldolase/adducin family protein [Christensenellales bacterium]
MLLQQERELVQAYGLKMLEKGLTTGTSGNISVFNRKEGLYAMSPSSMDYHEIRPEDVVIIDLEETSWRGPVVLPLSMLCTRSYYAGREDVNAVVHTLPLCLCGLCLWQTNAGGEFHAGALRRL